MFLASGALQPLRWGRLVMGSSWKARRLRVWEAAHRKQKLDFTMCCLVVTKLWMEAGPLGWLMQCGQEGCISCPREYKSLVELADALSLCEWCLWGVIQVGSTELSCAPYRKVSMIVLGSLPVTDPTLFFKPIFGRNVCNRIDWKRLWSHIWTCEHWLWPWAIFLQVLSLNFLT